MRESFVVQTRSTPGTTSPAARTPLRLIELLVVASIGAAAPIIAELTWIRGHDANISDRLDTIELLISPTGVRLFPSGCPNGWSPIGEVQVKPSTVLIACQLGPASSPPRPNSAPPSQSSPPAAVK